MHPESIEVPFAQYKRTFGKRPRVRYQSDIRFSDGPSLLVNDECVDSRANRPGICMLAKDCPSVEQEFRKNGRNPTICTYQGNDLVVCCPSEPSLQPQQPRQKTTQPPEQLPTFSWSAPQQPWRPNDVVSNNNGGFRPTRPTIQPWQNENVVFGQPAVRKSQASRF